MLFFWNSCCVKITTCLSLCRAATQTPTVKTPAIQIPMQHRRLQYRPLCRTAIQTATKPSETCLGIIHIWSVFAPEAVPVTTKHHGHICNLHALLLNHSHSLAAQQRCLSQLDVWPFWMEVQVHTACMQQGTLRGI